MCLVSSLMTLSPIWAILFAQCKTYRPACVCMQIWLANLHVYTTQTKQDPHTHTPKHTWHCLVSSALGVGRGPCFRIGSALGWGPLFMDPVPSIKCNINKTHSPQQPLKSTQLTCTITRFFGGVALNLCDTFLAFGHRLPLTWPLAPNENTLKHVLHNKHGGKNNNSPRKPTTTSAIIIPAAFVFEAFPFCCTCWFSGLSSTH